MSRDRRVQKQCTHASDLKNQYANLYNDGLDLRISEYNTGIMDWICKRYDNIIFALENVGTVLFYSFISLLFERREILHSKHYHLFYIFE